MEVLLILILGGLSWWLMRPLRDWYVVEIRRGIEAGNQGINTNKQIFQRLEAAEQNWAQTGQVMRQAGDSGQLLLWHIEARSRSQALSGKLPKGVGAVLLKKEEIKA